MSKYIDAERLKAEVEKRMHICDGVYERDSDTYYQGKAVAYQETLSFITFLQQEQLEVELEKFTDKIKTFQGRYKHPEIVSIKGAMAFIARMFYQYPNIARQWYDSLPKATMD